MYASRSASRILASVRVSAASPVRALPTRFASSSSSSNPSGSPAAPKTTNQRSTNTPSSPPSTANNKGNYAANKVPISSTSNPEPNRAPHNIKKFHTSAFSRASDDGNSNNSTVKVADTLKNAYSGLKESVLSAKESVLNAKDKVMESSKSALDSGKEAMSSASDSVSKTSASLSSRVNNMATRLEEKMEKEGLGPVTGEEQSVIPGGQNPNQLSASSDAAVGGMGSQPAAQGEDLRSAMRGETPGVTVRNEGGKLKAVDEHVPFSDSNISMSGAGGKKQSTNLGSQSSQSYNSQRSSTVVGSSDMSNEQLSSSSNRQSARPGSAERSENNAPSYGVSSTGPEKKANDSARLSPIDSSSASSESFPSQAASSTKVGQTNKPNYIEQQQAKAGEGRADRGRTQRDAALSDTATDRVAGEQRKQGLSSSELLGMDNIRAGNKEEKARAPRK